MSDELAAPVTPDTPTTDWEKRYGDLRPQYDRTTAELADERGVWDDEQKALARFQERFPHLIAEDDDEPVIEHQQVAEPGVNPDLEDLKAWRNQQDADKAERDRADAWNGWNQHIDGLADKAGVELPQMAKDALWRASIDVQNGGYPIGPDQAATRFQEFLDGQYKPFLEQHTGGQRPRAPHTLTGGDGPQAKDPADMTAEEKSAWVVSQLHAANSGS